MLESSTSYLQKQQDSYWPELYYNFYKAILKSRVNKGNKIEKKYNEPKLPRSNSDNHSL